MGLDMFIIYFKIKERWTYDQRLVIGEFFFKVSFLSLVDLHVGGELGLDMLFNQVLDICVSLRT